MRAWRAGLWLSGAIVFTVGLAGLLRHSVQTHPDGWLTFLLGGLLAHDLVLAPATAAASWALVRWAPHSVRPALMGGLIVAASLVAVAIPVVGGFGRLPNNPSILPSHHYFVDLLLCLAVVAGATAAVARLLSRDHGCH